MTKSAVNLPKRRPRGRSFPKGVSGNPGGRPKGAKTRLSTVTDVRLLAREHGPEAVKQLAAILTSEAATDMAKIAAANCLLDRGWGRPPQAVELTGAEGGPIRTEAVSAREFIAGKLAELGARSRAEEDPRTLN